MIMPWVAIGNGVIVWAWAVVTKDVPDYAIVAWVPAKIIKYRFSENIISFLQSQEWWNWSLDKMKKNIAFFKTDLNKISLDELEKIIVS